MPDREKLIEAVDELNFFRNCHYNDSSSTEEYKLAQAINDVMPTLAEIISHGVTVQEWISVKDRLPEEECRCLVIDAAGDIEMDCYDGKGRFVLDRSGAVQHPSHWMPLPKMPQPPKGE